jgi:hypothetical protein
MTHAKKSLLCLQALIFGLCVFGGTLLVHAGLYPPEAYQACEGKKPGQPGRITNQRGDLLQGICTSVPEGLVLLKPRWTRAEDLTKPARNAANICKGKKAGTKVHFVGKNKELISGKCDKKQGKIEFFPDKSK